MRLPMDMLVPLSTELVRLCSLQVTSLEDTLTAQRSLQGQSHAFVVPQA
jgi:hypothetical protein